MQEITMVFKGGAVQTFTCEKIAWNKNGFGELTNLSWEKAVEKRPLHIDLSEVAAIFVQEVEKK